MDARVDGNPVTARSGKPVEVNALWIRGLQFLGQLARSVRADPSRFDRIGLQARTAFARFQNDGHVGLADVVDGPDGIDGFDSTIRPNQLIAAATPDLLAPEEIRAVLRATEPLVTAVGVRSLSPDDPRYRGHHRGDSASRDAAYHQGTIWPWLVGPLVDAHCADLDEPDPAAVYVVQSLVAHLGEYGLGSVSETFEGDAPHAATGCPFQAWSVAELIRARRKLLKRL